MDADWKQMNTNEINTGGPRLTIEPKIYVDKQNIH